LGLAGFIAIHSFGRSLDNHLDENLKEILTADLVVSSNKPLTPKDMVLIEKELGADKLESRLISFYSMVKTETSSRLIRVMAIDNTYPTALKDNDLEVMTFVYEKYGIDSTQFTQSDLYYASEPKQYREIYQALHDRLQQQRDSITDAIQKGRNEDKKDDPSKAKD
jgi:hypothetical protein